MTLLGMRCFLRGEEICSVELDHFCTECSVVQQEEKRIDQIVLRVQGKADTEEQYLSIYRDDENTEFCLVRLLMIYIAKAKITGGFLFPNFEDLEANLDDNNKPTEAFDVSYCYEKFLRNLKVRN